MAATRHTCLLFWSTARAIRNRELGEKVKCQCCDTADTHADEKGHAGKDITRGLSHLASPFMSMRRYTLNTTRCRSRRLVQTLYLFHDFNRSEGAKRPHYGVLEQGQMIIVIFQFVGFECSPFCCIFPSHSSQRSCYSLLPPKSSGSWHQLLWAHTTT